MLVLSRKSGDEIRIPDVDVVIRVQRIRGKTVSIGIEAPQFLRILRGELDFESDGRGASPALQYQLNAPA